MGSEPAIGLVDHALLFADVEKTENLGDFLLANAKSTAHVDLLLGTRGWRRFVWRNDAAAQAAIAARGSEADGVLAREGFSHVPQVASNLAAAQASGNALLESAVSAQRRLQTAGPIVLLALLLLLLAESAVRIVRGPSRARWLPVPILAAVVVFLVMLLQLRTLGGQLAPGADFAPVSAPAASMQFSAPEPAFDSNSWTSAGGRYTSRERRHARFDNFGASDLLYDEFDSGGLALGRSEFLPIPVVGSRAQLSQFPPQPRNLQDQQARRVRHYAHRNSPSEERSDFTPTIYWNALVVTDEQGRAEVGFDTSDAVTTWRVRADAHVDAHVEVAAGRLGQGTAEFQTRLPLQIELKLPDEVAAGDQLLLPIAAEVVDPTQTEVALTITPAGGLRLLGDAPATIALQQGRGRALLRFAVADQVGSATLTVTAKAGRFTDVLQRRIRISPRGFPQRRSFAGMVTTSIPGATTLTLPASALAGSGRATLKVFPSPLSTLLAGLDGMLQEPHGCFEQTSSTNYPNTLVLALLERSGEHAPAAASRARELLAKGYQRLIGFECKRGGFEWFGKDPGHEALTAYGLLQFHDMARVSDVDATMLARTSTWLLGRRNGSGDFVHDGTDQHSFGRSQPVTNAWCTMALLQTGTPADQLGRELTALVARVERADAYELAVIATALQLADRGEAVAARQRLAGMQQPDGSLRGATSLTQSGGTDLLVETTSLALLAWLPDPARSGNVQQALEFIQRCRRANGTFGASQATVCALRAIVGYVDATKPTRSDGTLIVRSGERELLRASYAANATEPLEFALWPLLGPGEHALRLEVEGKDSPASLPWSLDVTYYAEQPADDPQAPMQLATTLRRLEVQEGDTVALDLELRNTTDAEVPTPIAVIGLPAGCELPTRVLEDLGRAEAFAAWELTGRTLVLYWRRLLPGERRQLTLDLIARLPGTTTGPASRCTPYYAPDAVHWAAPLSLKVAPR